MSHSIVVPSFPEGPTGALTSALQSNRWFFQEKIDGIRTAIFFSLSGEAIVVGRNGTESHHSYARHAVQVAASIPGQGVEWVLDGESTAQGFHAFDTWTYPPMVFQDRLVQLEGLRQQFDFLNVVDTHQGGSDETIRWLLGLIDRSAEGIVARSTHSRPVSNDGAFKYKFTRSGDFRVIGKEPNKQSVRLGARVSEAADESLLMEIGSASTIGKGPIEVGDLVEVEYLYVKPGGRLYQPRIKRKRTDKDETDPIPAEYFEGSRT